MGDRRYRAKGATSRIHGVIFVLMASALIAK